MDEQQMYQQMPTQELGDPNQQYYEDGGQQEMGKYSLRPRLPR